MALRSFTFKSQLLAHRPLLRSSPSILRLSSSVSGAAVNTSSKNDVTTTTTATATTTAAKGAETIKNAATATATAVLNKEHGYEHGSLHWNKERASAIVLIPLISTQFLYGPHSIVDGLLGVVLPYHIYLGFDSCITDYIPKRKFPKLHKLANWTLAGTTGLVMWGCYEFNTNDVGITEFMQRFFTA